MMTWSEGERHSVTVTVPDQSSLLQDIARHLADRQGFSIATLNLDHVIKMSGNPHFRAAYNAHTHVTADGNPIVWLLRLAGQTVQLVPGSDLIDPVMAQAAKMQVGVALFGSTQDTLTKAAEILRVRHPGLEITLCHAPDMGFDPDAPKAEKDLALIKASKARLVFLALGAPKQEIFAARAQEALPEVGFISIGAGLDFIAGTQKRAPAWVRKIAAEWLWRLLCDPRRLTKRYLACIFSLPRLIGKALRHRWRAKSLL